jgi:hypothetical protein
MRVCRTIRTTHRESSRRIISGTGEPDAVKSCTSGSQRGGWKRTRKGNALAAYSTGIRTRMNTEALERLRAFRQHLYTTFGCRRDALFETLDALLTAPVIEHPAYLSLAPGLRAHLGQHLRCAQCRNHAAAPIGIPRGRTAARDRDCLVCR